MLKFYVYSTVPLFSMLENIFLGIMSKEDFLTVWVVMALRQSLSE